MEQIFRFAGVVIGHQLFGFAVVGVCVILPAGAEYHQSSSLANGVGYPLVLVKQVVVTVAGEIGDCHQCVGTLLYV